MSERDVLVVGEALADVVVRPDGTGEVRPGGSPANVAVGLARLGIPTDLLCRLGADAHGDVLRDHLGRAGVGPHRRRAGPPRRTSTAAATVGADGAASYRFDIDWDIAAIDPGPVRAFHTGSLATVLEPGASFVLAALGALPPETLVSFDPNVRPAFGIPREEVLARTERMARHAHIVKMSDEDLDWLYPDASLGEVAARMHSLGVRLVVVTRGARGCHLSTPEWTIELPAAPVSVVDTIGAGDAFMSGLLFAVLDTDGDRLLRSGDVPQHVAEEWARIALRSAAITVGRRGAQPPWPADLEERV